MNVEVGMQGGAQVLRQLDQRIAKYHILERAGINSLSS